MDEELLTYSEVEGMTGLKLGTLYSMVKRHEIPHVRLGRRLVRFRRTDLTKWLAEHSIPAHLEVA